MSTPSAPTSRSAALPRDPLLGRPLRHTVRDAVARALRRAVANGALPAPNDAALDALVAGIEVEIPGNRDHGDYASNVAMKGSKVLKRAPAQIAAAIQLLVQVARLPSGQRRVMSITELRGMQGRDLSMHDVFRYEPDTGTLVPREAA